MAAGNSLLYVLYSVGGSKFRSDRTPPMVPPFLKLLARLQAVQIPQYIFFHTFTSNESFFRRNDEEKEKN